MIFFTWTVTICHSNYLLSVPHNSKYADIFFSSFFCISRFVVCDLLINHILIFWFFYSFFIFFALNGAGNREKLTNKKKILIMNVTFFVILLMLCDTNMHVHSVRQLMLSILDKNETLSSMKIYARWGKKFENVYRCCEMITNIDTGNNAVIRPHRTNARWF